MFYFREGYMTTTDRTEKTDKETSDKQKALDIAMSHIDRQFGKGSIMRLGEKAASMERDAIPTGSLSLDLALGIGGIPRGRVVEVFGAEASGKSTLSYVLSGRNGYKVTKGNIVFKGKNLLELEVEERAILGIFLAGRNPPTHYFVCFFGHLKKFLKSPSNLTQITIAISVLKNVSSGAHPSTICIL